MEWEYFKRLRVVLNRLLVVALLSGLVSLCVASFSLLLQLRILLVHLLRLLTILSHQGRVGWLPNWTGSLSRHARGLHRLISDGSDRLVNFLGSKLRRAVALRLLVKVVMVIKVRTIANG